MPPAPIRIDSNDLLSYNATYQILICRECQYAIQKSAVSNHLLRHKIYREDRQRVLSSIAHFDLLEPEHVSLPSPLSPAVEGLPVTSGYRCVEAACGFLCASSKRMKRHRKEVHGVGDDDASSMISSPVKIQTFFRGNKLKYFEVAPSLKGHSGGLAPETDSIAEHDLEMRVRCEHGPDEVMRKTIATNSEPEQRYAEDDSARLRSTSISIDLQVLTYFHHFVSVTSFTLPVRSEQHPNVWQTEIVPLALRQQWLMSGLLALSAYHIATLAEDAPLKRLHYARAVGFWNNFCAKRFRLDGTTVGEEENVEMAAQHISTFLRLARWASAEFLDEVFSFQSCITTLRSLAATGPILSSTGKGQEETFARAGAILESCPLLVVHSDNPRRDLLLNRLRVLPSRLSEIFGKPSEVQSVLATLSAIAALVVCCEASFASDERDVAWRGIVLWLMKLSEHFHGMIMRQDSAAMMVVHLWLLLVERARDHGCWFLEGLALRMHLDIENEFDEKDVVLHLLRDDG